MLHTRMRLNNSKRGCTLANNVLVPNAPEIPGLAFRFYDSEADLKAVLDVMNLCYKADRRDICVLEEMLRNHFRSLQNFDIHRQLLLATMDEEIIGYSQMHWFAEGNGDLELLNLTGHLLPEWRRKRIGTAMFRFSETHLRSLVPECAPGIERRYQSGAFDCETGQHALLKHEGYTSARYFYQMVRPNLDDIPEFDLPEGIIVRTPGPDEYMKVGRAIHRAFQDHWGFVDGGDEEIQAYLNNPYCRPELWQIAWYGDEVVGTVCNFIPTESNRAYNRKRGFTEDITVQREWRNRGIAKALIARSMQRLKEEGIEEVALGVDTENYSGALRLYEGLGYKPVSTETIYRKPVEVDRKG